MHRCWMIGWGLLLAMALAGCNLPGMEPLAVTAAPTPVASLVPVPTLPPPPETLIVCLRDEPASLYLYGDLNASANTVLEALYDGPVDLRSYASAPVVLEDVPSLTGGTARLETVEIGTGDVYLNPLTLQPENLQPLKPYLPSGCTDSSCIRNFQGGMVAMDRLSADFRIRQGVRWSDGEPVRGADSVLSFHLDASNDTPTTKYLVDRTTTYQALDEQTVRWTGIPGYLEADLGDVFWSPLPAHVIGDRSAAEVGAADDVTRSPLGWGPYVLTAWEPGRQIVMERNPDYFRAGEGLPAFDQLVFRFIGQDERSGLQQILTGECDVLDETALYEDAGEAALRPETLQSILDLQAQGQLQVVSSPGFLVERLEFNTQPASRKAASPFTDLRVRLAMAACIDRPRLMREVLGGMGGVTDTFLPADHPLYRPPDVPIAFATEAGAALLDQAGWLDEDADASTPRTARGARGLPDGTPFILTLTVPQGEFHQALGAALKEDLAACGISLEVQAMPAGSFLEAWPEGAVFGRGFQAASWAWPTLNSPMCEMYASWEIPTDTLPGGVNASGYWSEAYDAACRSLMVGGEAARGQAVVVQQQFGEAMPALPLFQRPRLVLAAPSLCGFQPDPSTLTQLWSLETIRRGEACGPAAAPPTPGGG